MLRSFLSTFVFMYVFALNRVYSQICSSTCPCDCNSSYGTLDCSSLGVSNATVCGPLDNFQRVNFTDNQLTELYVSDYGTDCIRYDFSHNLISAVVIYFQFYRDCDDILLDLSHNAIKGLNRGAIYLGSYDDMKSTLINISFNQIEYLEQGSFDFYVVSDRSSDSFFDSFSDSEIVIDLSFNRLLSIHQSALYVYFNSGDLHLLLKNNNLKNFALSQFEDYIDASNYVFNLQNNSISGFREEDVEYGYRDNVALILDENPWNCDCDQRFVSFNSSRLRSLLSNDMSVQPICETPSVVSGRPLLSLSEDEFCCAPKLDPNVDLDLQVSEGDTLNLHCPFIGGDPSVTYVDWQFLTGTATQGQGKSSFHVQNCFNCSLVIKNIHKDAEGVYQCTVTNGERLTIEQTVMVVDVTTPITELHTTAEPNGSRVSNGASIIPLLPVVIFLSVMMTLVLISLIIVSYKLYKSTKNNLPLTRPDKNENTQKAPRYDVTVRNQAFVGEEEGYVEPDAIKPGGTEENEQDIYEITE
ncbi:uncharacterized protein [Apostichopus japonicus]|uniref:uncharacterized protein n=1 Tax=Stichopus japonicus TaxID=307972 RepID=UPI003AB5DCEC